MTNYGYVAHTFRVFRRGRKDEVSRLGAFNGEDGDALPYLYGALHGLAEHALTDGTRHLRAKSVLGVGRTVKFTVETGHSGQTSQFFDPDDDSKPVFERSDRHIEFGIRRGMLVAPADSINGLLITEVHGRSGAKTLLAPALSRIFRFHTEHVLEIAAVVDQAALHEFIAEARAHTITLRRSGLPADIADMVDIADRDAEQGKIELKISPGKIKQFQRDLVDRLRGDDETRRRLLQVHGLDFDELSVGMTVGARRTTLTVTADRVPSFVYDIPGRTLPSDDDFFDEIMSTAREIAPAVGVNVGSGWNTGTWSTEQSEYTLAVPEEAPSCGPADDPE